MCRTNSFIADLSAILRDEHIFKTKRLPPIEHGVVWDAELSAAAAAIVGSIMEWSQGSPSVLGKTLRLISHYYQLRNAEHPSKAARENARKYRGAAEQLTSGSACRPKAVNELQRKCRSGVPMLGDPVKDWRTARGILSQINALADVFRDARMAPLFRARDALARGLSEQWVNGGHYGSASDLVKSILDREKFLSADRAPRGCMLMTIHKSKAKEFDGVVLVDGAFKSQFFDTSREQPPYEMSRRLLRVGLTRARSLVTIIRPVDAPPLVG